MTKSEKLKSVNKEQKKELLKKIAKGEITSEEVLKAISPKEYLPTTKTFVQEWDSDFTFTCGDGKVYTRSEIDKYKQPGIKRILVIKHPPLSERKE
jgi:hypothetical protein